MNPDLRARLARDAEGRAASHPPDLDAAVDRGSRQFRRSLLLRYSAAVLVVCAVLAAMYAARAVTAHNNAGPVAPSSAVTSPGPSTSGPSSAAVTSPSPSTSGPSSPAVTSPATSSPAPGLVSIEVTPHVASVSPGSTVPLTATGSFDNGTTADITRSVTWTARPAGAVMVDPSGQVTGEVPGKAIVTATMPGSAASGAAEIVVSAPTSSVPVS